MFTHFMAPIRVESKSTCLYRQPFDGARRGLHVHPEVEGFECRAQLHGETGPRQEIKEHDDVVCLEPVMK